MSRLQQKPILHGRDHASGGVDPIPGIGGIGFDTYPQAGNWLYAETDDESGAGGSPSGYGIELDDFSTGGVFLGALGGGGLTLRTVGGGLIWLRGSGQVKIDSGGSSSILVTSQDIMTLQSIGEMLLKSNPTGGATPQIHLEEGSAYDLTLDLSQGILTVATNGTPILVVDATTGGVPGYHIATGGSWVADL